MGQRTQLVLKTKDRFGTVKNKVYHEQWGFAKTMPMIILDFLIQLNYGSCGQKKYVDVFNKPNIVTLNELNAMTKAEMEDTVARLQNSSIHNLELNSYNVSEEDGYTKRYVHTTQDGKVEILNEEVHKISKDDIPLLEWDFDITNPDNVWKFVGDNNDGMALVVVEERYEKNKQGYRDIKFDVKIGFLTSLYEDEDYSDEKNTAIQQENSRYHDLISYTEPDREHYCPLPIMNAIKELYEYFEVEELGKGIPLNPKVLEDEEQTEKV